MCSYKVLKSDRSDHLSTGSCVYWSGCWLSLLTVGGVWVSEVLILFYGCVC